MRKFSSVILLGALLVASMSAVATMQAPPPPPKPPAAPGGPPPPPPPPLPPPGPHGPASPYKVDVVIQRTKGTTVLSSLPNSLNVGAAMGETGNASLRIGSQVPYPSEMPGNMNTNYQDVGTNIDCLLTPRADGRYEVRLTIQDSSVAPQEGLTRTPPVLRNYRIVTTVVTRDGQMSQVNLSTDKNSGETVTAQVTVTALKS
jgi:hypothetical protein